MIDDERIKRQVTFYRQGKAGCSFAAHAATNPERYGWSFVVVEPRVEQIEEAIAEAIADPSVSTRSLLFPSVTEVGQLLSLTEALRQASCLVLEQMEVFAESICLGYRVTVGSERSYVSGFGDFPFLPKTRRAPLTEIAFRAKPRPAYKVVMKPAPPGIIHLADMDMFGMKKRTFESLWQRSFDQTRRILGHRPDLRSAARTTFALPVDLWERRRVLGRDPRAR